MKIKRTCISDLFSIDPESYRKWKESNSQSVISILFCVVCPVCKANTLATGSDKEGAIERLKKRGCIRCHMNEGLRGRE